MPMFYKPYCIIFWHMACYHFLTACDHEFTREELVCNSMEKSRW